MRNIWVANEEFGRDNGGNDGASLKEVFRRLEELLDLYLKLIKLNANHIDFLLERIERLEGKHKREIE